MLASLGCATTPTGAARPALEALPLESTAGQQSSVGGLLSQADATVFVFWSSGCPCVVRYQERVDALAKAWAARGIQVVEVSSNAGETLASLRVAATERRLVRPLWRDEGGQLAQALQARSTPTVVLLRRDGTLLYRGWLDNERLPGEAGREAWLETALEAFAEGRSAPAKSPTWGCTITKSLAPLTPASCHVPTTEVAETQSPPGGSP